MDRRSEAGQGGKIIHIMFDNGGMGTACLDCIIEFFKCTNRAAGDITSAPACAAATDTAWPIPRLAQSPK